MLSIENAGALVPRQNLKEANEKMQKIEKKIQRVEILRALYFRCAVLPVGKVMELKPLDAFAACAAQKARVVKADEPSSTQDNREEFHLKRKTPAKEKEDI